MKIRSLLFYISLIILSILFSACAARKSNHAPIVELGAENQLLDSTKTPSVSAPVHSPSVIKSTAGASDYEVQKGDTLYSIAFAQGVDFRALVAANNLENPNAIQAGQHLIIPSVNAGVRLVEKRPLLPLGTKTQPQAIKIPYSDRALAQAEQISGVSQVAIASPALPAKVPPVVKVSPSLPPDDDDDAAEDGIDWAMPTTGKVLAGFSESANRKGVDIAGKTGQAILASAAGKVVYSGNGLRGYGKLIIIKHNKVFLSAYAHNDQIIVKEGQLVKKGQKIAEMGNTDADQVKLHFEIRKLGKPVDPVQFLPLLKS
jgi:lipoprotein NlpD